MIRTLLIYLLRDEWGVDKETYSQLLEVVKVLDTLFPDEELGEITNRVEGTDDRFYLTEEDADMFLDGLN